MRDLRTATPRPSRRAMAERGSLGREGSTHASGGGESAGTKGRQDALPSSGQAGAAEGGRRIGMRRRKAVSSHRTPKGGPSAPFTSASGQAAGQGRPFREQRRRRGKSRSLTAFGMTAVGDDARLRDEAATARRCGEKRRRATAFQSQAVRVATCGAPRGGMTGFELVVFKRLLWRPRSRPRSRRR